MSEQLNTMAPALSRRALLLNGAATLAAFSALPSVSIAGDTLQDKAASITSDAVRPFKVRIPDSALIDLRRRLAGTRWPDAELVADRSQGVQNRKLQSLVRYWEHDYDWRKAEARLNAFPQYMTRIDGLDIHFIHVRSPHPQALPLVMTHGWPGSIFELLKVIGPLTDPVAHGGRVEDAFHLVLPSLPGFGFSEKPSATGWNPDRIALAWDVLMKRLGYSRYVSQGGDWGAIVSDAMARQAPEGLLGIHVNRVERATTVPPEVAKAIAAGGAPPLTLSADERVVFEEIKDFYKNGLGYASIMGSRPQTIGVALSDSPAALAAWCYDKFADWVFTRGEPERSLTNDQMLDDISLYWFTNTGTSSARIYWENGVGGSKPAPVSIPAAVTIFPGEVYKPPRAWTERAYKNLIYYNRVDKGGHFAAWEEPQLFSDELRQAFRPLRSKTASG